LPENQAVDLRTSSANVTAVVGCRGIVRRRLKGAIWDGSNIEHRTSNAEHRTRDNSSLRRSTFDVGCSMFIENELLPFGL